MEILDLVGNTPLVKIYEDKNILLKIEGANLFGSIKDRAAVYIIERGIEDGFINRDTEVIESSSGNFAIALAGICNIKDIKFSCVIDPLISQVNKRILEIYKANIIIADVCDSNGSYVRERIRIVNSVLENNSNFYWPNQYDNPIICEAYEKTIGTEIAQIKDLDYVFVAVSTCGTIAGISKALKHLKPNVKVIAVDIEGSKIFQNKGSKKYINGMGASFTPANLEHAIIDDVIMINTDECISGCARLLEKGIFAGGSSGAVFAACLKYSRQHKLEEKVLLCVLPDRGERYIDTIYNNQWKRRIGLWKD